MPEMLVEGLPFIIGAALGWMTSSLDLSSWLRCVQAALGCVGLGTMYASLVGEPGVDWLVAVGAVCIDSASFAIGALAARFTVNRLRTTH